MRGVLVSSRRNQGASAAVRLPPLPDDTVTRVMINLAVWSKSAWLDIGHNAQGSHLRQASDQTDLCDTNPVYSTYLCLTPTLTLTPGDNPPLLLHQRWR